MWFECLCESGVIYLIILARVDATSRLTKYWWLEQKVQHFNILEQVYDNEEKVFFFLNKIEFKFKFVTF